MLVIADGMGGHAAGDTASRLVVAAFAPLDSHAPQQDLLGALREATLDGNAAIAETVDEHPELDGMGTTVTALYFDGSRLAIAHVGDSRAYLYRSGILHQLTHDDTFVQSLVDDGRITEEEAIHHPQRNLLLRALNGTDLEPSLTQREARSGDRYLICSDGLSGVVSAEAIADALTETDPERAADLLVELALVGGGPDNVTVIVADVMDTGAPATERIAPVVIDPDATGPIGQMTREMPRIPLPPIPEEPGAPTRYAADPADEDEDELEDDDLDDEDLGDGDRVDDVADQDERFDTAGSKDRSGTNKDSAGDGARAAGVTLFGLFGRGRRNRRAAAEDPNDPATRRRRWRRRGAFTLAIVALLLVAIAGSSLWVRTQFFVGARGTEVVGVYRGVNGSLVGVQFSSFQEDSCAGAVDCTPIRLSDLEPAARIQVLAGIQASSLADARAVMVRLSGRLLPPCAIGSGAGGGSVPPPSGNAGGTDGGTTSPAFSTTAQSTTAPTATSATSTASTTSTPHSTGAHAGDNGVQGTWPDVPRTHQHGTVVTVTVDDTGAGTRPARATQPATPSVVTTTVTPAPTTATERVVVTQPPVGLYDSVAGRALTAPSTSSGRATGQTPARVPAVHTPTVSTTTVGGKPSTSIGSHGTGKASTPSTAAATAGTGTPAGSPAPTPPAVTSTVTAETPTVTLTQTETSTPAATGTPLAPAAQVPGVTCRVIG